MLFHSTKIYSGEKKIKNYFELMLWEIKMWLEDFQSEQDLLLQRNQ